MIGHPAAEEILRLKTKKIAIGMNAPIKNLRPNNMNTRNLIAIRYDHDTKHNRFILVCGYHLNHILNKTPSRRFRRRTKDWTVPNLRANVKVLAEHENMLIFEDEKSKEIFNETLNTKVNANHEPFPLGFPFKLPPKPKQAEALDQLWGLPYFAIFSKAGTGKSKISLDLVMARKDKLNGLLLVVPFYIRHNWIDEIVKHAAFDVDSYIFDTKGWNKLRKAEYENWLIRDEGFKIGIVGLESLKMRNKETDRPTGRMYPLVERFLMHGNVAMVVDESHHIKNPQSNTTRNCTDLGLLSPYKGIMSGTPVTKDSLDLFSQYNFLSPEILGIDSYYSFRNHYAELGGFQNKQTVGLKNQYELAELVAPVTFQCTLAEMGAETKVYMPPRRWEMTQEQKDEYDRVRKKRLIDGVGDSPSQMVENVLQIYLALQQICNGFVTYTDESVIENSKGDEEVVKTRVVRRILEPKDNPKLKLMLQMAEDMEPDGQVIIWSKYRQTIRDVGDFLGEDQVNLYYGDMTEAELMESQRSFLAKEKRFFCATPTLAGTGLNWLVQAEDAIYLDNTYKYIDREQTEGRNNRLTSVNPARYWDMFPVGGLVDGVIYESIRQKKDVADFVEDNIQRCLVELGFK